MGGASDAANWRLLLPAIYPDPERRGGTVPAPSYALNHYQRMAVQTANPLRQITALYDGAVHFLNQAKAALEARDIAAKSEATGRALDIISYLRGILDFEQGGEIAHNLDRLYDYMTTRMLQASARLEVAPYEEVIGLLATLREGWEQLSQHYERDERAATGSQTQSPAKPLLICTA